MSGVDASAPTARKALKLKGIPRPSRKCKTHLKRYCMQCPNDAWNIDFVQIGKDAETGKPVESLSVSDDHSRFAMSSDATTSATTDHVIAILEALIGVYGCPRIIRSDHGCQWYSTCGGDSRFDEWCESKGIRHVMASIRTPEENGKIERYHGCLRTEAALPEKATVQEYREHLDRYRDFYNNVRPHWSLDLRTPSEVYNKTSRPHDDVMRDLKAVFDEFFATYA